MAAAGFCSVDEISETGTGVTATSTIVIPFRSDSLLRGPSIHEATLSSGRHTFLFEL
jgi:hypothetical protein